MARRHVFVAVGVAVGLSAVPMAALGAPAAPKLTLLSPTAESAVSGLVSVQWSYSAFHRSTPVDVEVRRGTGPFVRIARVRVDDGTPGYYGSASWQTTADDDAADWEVRVTAPTNRQVGSSVAPVTVDNTGPATTVNSSPPAAVLVDIGGTATDTVSAVTSVSVTFSSADGAATPARVTCACGSPSAAWGASTAGLPPGTYEVRAWAVDAVGNVGPVAAASMVIVGLPAVPDVPATVADAIGSLPSDGGETPPPSAPTASDEPFPPAPTTAVPTVAASIGVAVEAG